MQVHLRVPLRVSGSCTQTIALFLRHPNIAVPRSLCAGAISFHGFWLSDCVKWLHANQVAWSVTGQQSTALNGNCEESFNVHYSLCFVGFAVFDENMTLWFLLFVFFFWLFCLSSPSPAYLDYCLPPENVVLVAGNMIFQFKTSALIVMQPPKKKRLWFQHLLVMYSHGEYMNVRLLL